MSRTIAAQLREEWTRYTVLFLREQNTTDNGQVAFTRCFGAVENTIPIADGGPVGAIFCVDEDGAIPPPTTVTCAWLPTPSGIPMDRCGAFR